MDEPAMRLFPWQSPDDPHRALLERAQQGDRAAFRALYDALYDPVARFVARRVRSREDAEDLTSRIFQLFLEHLVDIDPQKGSVRMYVLSIARNAVIDWTRARRDASPIDEATFAVADERGTPLDSLLQEERRSALARALGELSEASRELLMLRYGDGLKHPEIAELLGESTAAIKQRLSRAQRVLRKKLSEQQVESGEAAEAEKGAVVDVRL